jgi:mono/diheme cytochrome c family protein
MRRVLKWAGFILAGVLGIVIIAIAVVYLISSSRMNKTYAINVDPVEPVADSAVIARGRHVAVIRGCVDCHGDGLEGKVFIDSPVIAKLTASNLTAGAGGVAEKYTNADWVRAIRHGVKPDGRPVLFMPSHEYYVLSDEDVGALISYIESVPPTDNVLPGNSVGPLGRILYVTGQLPLLPVELIDHDAERPAVPEEGPTAEYGAYLATGCSGCHGMTFSGGKIPGTPPDFIPPPNLTPDVETGLGAWTEEDFYLALKEGIRPDGRSLDVQYMPWNLTAQMTDDELKALWEYFQTLPPKPYGNR